MAFQASPALAADQLKFGKPPEWVVPQSIPAATPSASDRPVTILLHDQQSNLKPGAITSYTEIAFKIQKPEGLAAGNLSVQWNPATDTVTVNKVEIHRGGQVIDVLKSGQTFTTIRRESNLEAAMLDGVLTANIQPEGLQEGDVVVLATTSEHSDPVLKNHVEAVFAPWGGAQIGLAHARLQWPTTIPLKVQTSGALAAPRQGSLGDTKTYELTMTGVEPVVAPKNAPLRFQIGRMGEATDFRSWSEAAQLMMPLYTTAAVIPATGPLRDEVEKIRKASSDPHTRAELALRLVQDRIRYVALVMGQGGLVPTNAQTTWERRFGDCKAKTALLLALLHELGVAAEPVLANVLIGDAIAERLPMIGLFNHVLVRAHVGGKDYWLDGTRSGDKDLEAIQTPQFGWVLPVMENAQLVHLVPASLTRPNFERHVAVDASNGLLAPAAITVDEIYRNDSAVEYQRGYSQLSADQRDEYFRGTARSYFDGFEVSSSTAKFDESTRTMSVEIKGTAKLSWNDGWFDIPTSSIAFTPDFTRTPGPFSNAPIAVGHPRFISDIATIKLPPGVAQKQTLDAPVRETLAGVEYVRNETVSGDLVTIESSERSVVSEVPYKEALDASPRLKSLYHADTYLRMPNNYAGTDADLASANGQKLGSAADYVTRGAMLLDHGKYDLAIADFTSALELEPKNVTALAERAMSQTYKHDYLAAEKDLGSAQQIDTDNWAVLRAGAILDETRGAVAAAIAKYTKSLEKEPTDSFALLHRAQLYQSTWKYDAAINDFSQILRHDPKDVSALSYRALAFNAKGDRAAAQQDLAAARAIAPDDGSLRYAETEFARTDRNSDKELAALTKLIETSPAKGAALTERASTYFRLNRFDEALADTDQALKLGYTEVDVRLTRANIFMRLGQRQAVEAEADAMIRENSQSSFAFVAAGKSYQALGLREKAITALDHAISMQPSVMTYLNRADVRPSVDLAGRLADIEKALALAPDDVDALLQKAYNLTLKGDYAQALQLYDRAATIETDPDNRSIPAGRAAALYKSGQIEKARDIFASMRAHSKSPTDFESLCWTQARWNVFVQEAVKDCAKAEQLDPKTATGNFGIALLRAGRLADAIEKLTISITLSHSAESYMARAIAYQRKGQMTQASSDHAEALKLRPDEDQVFAEYGLKFDDAPASTTKPH